MPHIKINPKRCKGCMLCVSVCPKGLIKADDALNSRGLASARFNLSPECTGCISCALICPDAAIEVYK